MSFSGQGSISDNGLESSPGKVQDEGPCAVKLAVSDVSGSSMSHYISPNREAASEDARDNMPAISSMTKKELVAEIILLGGEASSQGRKLELQQQLQSLREENGVYGGPPVTLSDYQVLTREMNKASIKKSELVIFMKARLGLTAGPNQTMVQLQKQALLKIYDLSKTDQTDPVGFGKHGSLSYEEVYAQQESYCEWVKTTAKEDSSNPLLARLARWLERQPLTRPTLKEEKNMPKSNRTKSEDSVAAASSSASKDTEVLRDLVGALQSLQEEVKMIKEENGMNRPRRQPRADETSVSDQSFEKVSVASVAAQKP